MNFFLGAAWTIPLQQELVIILMILFALVGAAGVGYAIFLGIMLAKAEDEGKRKQAKKRMLSTVAGLLIIVILTMLVVQYDFSDTFDMPDERYNPNAYYFSAAVFKPSDEKTVQLRFASSSSNSSWGSSGNTNMRFNTTLPDLGLAGKAIAEFEKKAAVLIDSRLQNDPTAQAFANGVDIRVVSPTEFEIINAGQDYPIRVDVDTTVYVPITAPDNARTLYGTTDPMEIMTKFFSGNPSAYPGQKIEINRTFAVFIYNNEPPVAVQVPLPPAVLVPIPGGGGSYNPGDGGSGNIPPILSPQNGVFDYWPVKEAIGPARSAGFAYISTANRYHAGIDIGWGRASLGNSTNVWVYAAHDGVVRTVSTGGARDYWYVTIEHSGTFNVAGVQFFNLRTNYIHINSIQVSVGQKVRGGQAIAKVAGSNAFDPHLHFEVTNGGGNNPKNSNPPRNATLAEIATKQRLLHPMMLYPNHGLVWTDRVPL